jgi:hypothetical protein
MCTLFVDTNNVHMYMCHVHIVCTGHIHLCVCTHTCVYEHIYIHVQVQPEEYQCVTIFFSEVVDFTTIASTMETHLVISMLDRLYTKFDVLTEWCRDSNPCVKC